METKLCEFCGAVFERPPDAKKNRWDKRRFCSRKCAAQLKRKPRPEKACLTCGKQLEGHPYRIKTRKYCSLACQPKSGADNPNWKNGGSFDLVGYRAKLVYPGHPFFEMAAKRGPGVKARHILEHRLVMAEHLGRPLEKYETVHHLNGDRSDNRIENLELWSSRHPKGQRVVELQEFAREILRLYPV